MEYVEAATMDELIIQYKKSLKDTDERINELNKEIAPFKEVLDDKNSSKQKKAQAQESVNDFLHELSIYRSIRSDLVYSIHWMEKGHSPENTRGIDRRAAYQKEKPIDPVLLQRYFRSRQPEFPWERDPKENVITRSEKEILDRATKALTKKELEVFLLFKGRSFSQYQIAEMLDISRNSVKTMISRANKKINAILLQNKGAV